MLTIIPETESESKNKYKLNVTILENIIATILQINDINIYPKVGIQIEQSFESVIDILIREKFEYKKFNIYNILFGNINYIKNICKKCDISFEKLLQLLNKNIKISKYIIDIMIFKKLYNNDQLITILMNNINVIEMNNVNVIEMNNVNIVEEIKIDKINDVRINNELKDKIKDNNINNIITIKKSLIKKKCSDKKDCVCLKCIRIIDNKFIEKLKINMTRNPFTNINNLSKLIMDEYKNGKLSNYVENKTKLFESKFSAVKFINKSKSEFSNCESIKMYEYFSDLFKIKTKDPENIDANNETTYHKHNSRICNFKKAMKNVILKTKKNSVDEYGMHNKLIKYLILNDYRFYSIVSTMLNMSIATLIDTDDINDKVHDKYMIR